MTLCMAMAFQITKDIIHKEIIGKLYFIKIRNMCSAKDTVKRIRQGTDWERISVKDKYIRKVIQNM